MWKIDGPIVVGAQFNSQNFQQHLHAKKNQNQTNLWFESLNRSSSEVVEVLPRRKNDAWIYVVGRKGDMVDMVEQQWRQQQYADDLVIISESLMIC